MKLILVLLLSGLRAAQGTEEPKGTGSGAVTAAVGDDIILPCSLQPPHDVTTLRVEWEFNGRIVHAYRSMGDHLDGQDVNFKDRTSLFKDEMAKGNISLKLINVREEDAGTYTCSVYKSKIPVIKANVTLTVNPGGESGKREVRKPDTSITDWILYPVFLIIAAAALGSIICVVQRRRRNSNSQTDNGNNAAPASEELPSPSPTSDVALLQPDAQEQTHGQRQERRESSSQNQEDNTDNTLMKKVVLVVWLLTQVAVASAALVSTKSSPSTMKLVLVLLLSGLRAAQGTESQTDNGNKEPNVTGSGAVPAAVGDDIILPCSLQPPHDVTTLRVEWEFNGRIVHAYRSMGDHLDGQDVNFKDRTSLFKDEMAKGNISLKLINVREEDAGTYTCSVYKSKIPVIKANVTLTVTDSLERHEETVPKPDTSITDWILYPVFLIIAAAALGSIICVVQRRRRNSKSQTDNGNNAAPASEELPSPSPTSDVALLQPDAWEQTHADTEPS
ncbi:butyrophilin-like protein 2 [Trachinotus anak]|uniref:butyrophilin-like protein 2 n=1 Tax=Trachinotus anak TaxID=443729 RepID=UPI0039F23959